MKDKICLPLKDSGRMNYICNESYIEYLKENKELDNKGYLVIKDSLVQTMEDLIQYCLVYNYSIDIPDDYKVIKLYNIVFCTGNFDPDMRECSNTTGSILYSSTDEQYIIDKFKTMCSYINKEPLMSSQRWFCWHTEDFAVNQIVHSYNIKESYFITK